MNGFDTQIVNIENPETAQAAFAQAGEWLRRGELVAFPTETVYGLGADAWQPAAVAKIFAAKGRPADNPLISHVADMETAERLVKFTPLGRKLAERFWPGPLTLVLPRRPQVPDVVTAGLPTAAVRFPLHAGAAAMLRAAKVPVAAPSANSSGKPSPTLARHVYDDLQGKLPLILDGGPVDIGLESTVVNACGDVPVLLRPGRITAEALRALCGDVALPRPEDKERPAAPGMKYRHYAPEGQVLLMEDGASLDKTRRELLAQGLPEPLCIVFEDTAAAYPRQDNFIIARRGDLQAFARNMFAALRLADAEKRQYILVETVPEQGLGAAIMNRLKKSAAKK
ncbi:MAG: threonylcarbamoyl-AMP synthase [Firmicutes bacterium]|nr:threonylcarbamoyl-AMP synthase [Bacillota bacterium]